MAKPNSSFEELARDAGKRIEDARAAGEQLTFLPDEPRPGESERAKRGRGRATSQLRDWCAARGLRMPEDVLIEMACMASRDDVMLTCMAKAEQMLAWAQAGAASEMEWVNAEGETKGRALRTEPTLSERLSAFQFFYTAALRSADALIPYGLGKVTPDPAPQVTVPIHLHAPAAPIAARPGDLARDVTPQPRRFGPPPMPHQIQQNQDLAAQPVAASAAKDRTE